jgi:hypothetical protein
MANEIDEKSLNSNADSATGENGGTLPADSDKDFKTLYENQKTRAEKAEAEAKRLKESNSSSSPKPAEATPAQTSPSVDVDERILLANGMPDELLKQLKDIARLRGLSLIDAQRDSLFVAVKSQYEKDETSKKASVRSSRGSGQVEQKKTLQTPGLTREEHKALAKGQ